MRQVRKKLIFAAILFMALGFFGVGMTGVTEIKAADSTLTRNQVKKRLKKSKKQLKAAKKKMLKAKKVYLKLRKKGQAENVARFILALRGNRTALWGRTKYDKARDRYVSYNKKYNKLKKLRKNYKKSLKYKPKARSFLLVYGKSSEEIIGQTYYNKLTWSSSNPDIVTVKRVRDDEWGECCYLKPTGVGKTYITAKTSVSKKKIKFPVTVEAPGRDTSLNLYAQEIDGGNYGAVLMDSDIGKQKNFEIYSSATEVKITSSDPSKVRVDSIDFEKYLGRKNSESGSFTVTYLKKLNSKEKVTLKIDYGGEFAKQNPGCKAIVNLELKHCYYLAGDDSAYRKDHYYGEYNYKYVNTDVTVSPDNDSYALELPGGTDIISKIWIENPEIANLTVRDYWFDDDREYRYKWLLFTYKSPGTTSIHVETKQGETIDIPVVAKGS